MQKLAELIENKIDDLAVSVKEGFDAVDKKFEQVDKRFEQVDKRFDAIDKRFEQVDDRFRNVEAHLAMMGRDLGEVRQNLVYRHEFEDALARISLLEKRLKIKSGK